MHPSMLSIFCTKLPQLSFILFNNVVNFHTLRYLTIYHHDKEENFPWERIRNFSCLLRADLIVAMFWSCWKPLHRLDWAFVLDVQHFMAFQLTRNRCTPELPCHPFQDALLSVWKTTDAIFLKHSEHVCWLVNLSVQCNREIHIERKEKLFGSSGKLSEQGGSAVSDLT